MHIRWEFIQLGADLAVDRLSNAEHDFLDTQIDVFMSRMKSDEAEFAKRFDLSRINADDPETMVEALNANLRNTRAHMFFTDVLRQGLQMPQNPVKMYV